MKGGGQGGAQSPRENTKAKKVKIEARGGQWEGQNSCESVEAEMERWRVRDLWMETGTEWGTRTEPKEERAQSPSAARRPPGDALPPTLSPGGETPTRNGASGRGWRPARDAAGAPWPPGAAPTSPARAIGDAGPAAELRGSGVTGWRDAEWNCGTLGMLWGAVARGPRLPRSSVRARAILTARGGSRERGASSWGSWEVVGGLGDPTPGVLGLE